MRMRAGAVAVVAAVIGLAGCSGSGSTAAHPPRSSTSPSPSASASDVALPIGDGKLSTHARAGYVWSCQPANPNAPGAQMAGPWITGTTWHPARKIHVAGDVTWPDASYAVRVHGSTRVITGNRLPVHEGTGVFPIASSDPAAAYDANPNRISAATVRITLPVNPRAAKRPSCLGFGAIGILNDGVLLFDALDAQGRDAVAHEVLDRCDGHPAPGGVYHHHDVPSCLLLTAGGRATLVGYALDGYGIYVERDASGGLLTNADLDACHGRTSRVPWNGREVSIYHYDATAEYPYTLGCYHGTPAVDNNGPPPSQPPSGP